MNTNSPDDMERNEEQVAEHEDEPTRNRFIPFFPHYVLDEVIIWYAGLAILIILASLFPAGIEEEANPLNTPPHIKPEWYFLFLFQFLKLVPRTVGVLAPGVLVIFLFLVPFLDRKPQRRPGARPVTMILALALIIFIIVLSVWAWQD